MAVTGADRLRRFGGHRLHLIVTYALLLLLLAAAVWAVVSHWGDLVLAVDRLSWWRIVGSLVAALLALLATLASWLVAVRAGGADLPLLDGSRIYFIGQVGKYLPGSVWPVLAQAHLGRRRGIPARRMASASLLSLAISVTVSLLVGVLLLPVAGGDTVHRLWWAWLIAVPLVPLLHPKVLDRLVRLAARLLRRGPVEVCYTAGAVAWASAWTVVASLFFGLHLFLLAGPLGASGPRGYLLCVAAYALAAGIGIAIIFLPAGAGAREAVLTVILAPVLSVQGALLLAIVSRAWLIIADLLMALIQLPHLRSLAQPVAPASAAAPDPVQQA